MDNIYDLVWANKLKFLGIFFLVFTISYLFLVAIDFLPEAPEKESVVETSELVGTTHDDVLTQDVIEENEDSEEFEVTEKSSVLGVVESKQEELREAPAMVQNREVLTPSDSMVVEPASLPARISIPALGKTITVLNPTSRNIVDLDNALLNGVVRHPDSATMNQEGNVFILGHSSYLPNVFNKNFQAFNGIQNLAWGDKIEVYSDDALYEYRVEKVYKANAQDATVPIAGTGHKLTLATCNSFGSIDDRWIVEAKRVSVKTL